MAGTSVIFGLLLAILGVYGYFGAEADHRSPTALIPAAFGLILIVLGALARRDALRKHAMHAAAAIAVLGFLFGAGWFIARPFVTNKPLADMAGLSTATMAVLCGAFVAVCVKSFIDARRRRKANAAPPPGA